MKADDLRASILQAAIRGKLTKQDPDDEPASVLVERIREEKRRLVKEGKFKRDKNESFIFKRDGSWFETINGKDERCIDDEIPFEIPDNWTWSRFLNITINRDAERIPLSSEERSHLVKTYDYYGASGVIDKVDRFIFDERLLLIGEDGANLVLRSKPIAFIAEGKYWVNNHAHVLGTYDVMSLDYICLFINSIDLTPYVTGTAQPKMNQKRMNQILIPIPPISEQKSIISRFSAVDNLIYEYGLIEEADFNLRNRISPRLLQSILNFAIQGKLTKQDPDDEPASVLVERIREEKRRLVKEGKFKRDKNESFIFKRDGSWFETINGKDERCIDDEIPFEIPENWTWMRFGSIGIQTRGNGIKRTDTLDQGRPCIRYGEIYTSYTYSFAECKSFIPESLFESVNHATYGDVLLTLTGENNIDIAKSVAYLGDETIAYGGDLLCISKHGFNPMFLSYVLYSPYCIDQKSKLSTGNIIVHISSSKLSGILIPIPPIEEQTKLVDVIDKLLIQCNSVRLLHD